MSSLYSNGLHSHQISIEHFWDVVEREIRIMDVQPTNLQQLRDAIMSIWTKISEECFQHLVESMCDEWGGAESRGNGARPVEWMIMNDTCATHRSRVPRRSFGRNKRRSDDIGRRERTRPGFYFMFCVRQSSARGCRFSVMFGYFVIKMFKCSPVPASFFPYIRTALHWCRSPGGRRDTLSESPRCWVGSRCWEDRAAGSGGDRQWLPEAVVLEQKKNRWDGRLAAVLLGRGGVAAVREGAEESPRSPGGRSLLPSAMFGEEQGTGDSLPAALDRRSHRRPPGGGWASGRPPKRSSTIAWHREWTAQLVEDRAAVCPGTGPRFFFFFFFFFSPLSPLSSLSLLILPSPFSRLVCPYPQVRRGRPDGLPPGEGGGGE